MALFRCTKNRGATVGYKDGSNTSVDLSSVQNYDKLVLFETLFPVAMGIYHYYNSSAVGSSSMTYTYNAKTGILSVSYKRDTNVTNILGTIRAYYIT